MGRGKGGKKSRTQRKHFQESRENVWNSKRPRSDSDPIPFSNPFATQNLAFDHYYKDQGIVSSQEWDAFVQLLRTPLPAAFRINSTSRFCADIRSQLENDFVHSLQAEVEEGDDTEAILPLPWYPDNLAWHSNFSRKQLRKNQTLGRFHEFLKIENEIGNITRQEAVSMVPPLFLDVHSNHFVLDMCAAPGSKTFQLLEILHHSTKVGSLPEGMVIANDLDIQRCNLLIHQTKRVCTANLIVTNHEAQHFPGCLLEKHYDKMELDQEAQLLFDRVLCDVPCSGDGTLRKAPDLWRKWNTGTGNGLHNLQVLIAMRGLSLLKVGGRMIYSTCSMNPIENEAVVAEVLRRCGGSIELVDVSSELPQLTRRPGLKRWKVCDKGKWFISSKDVPKFRRNVVLPSMFPSGRSYQDVGDSNCNIIMEGDINTDDVKGHTEDDTQAMENPAMLKFTEEDSDFPLERCMRFVPHDQNTGAFFIAVLQKVSALPAIQVKPRKEVGKQVDTANQGNEDAHELHANPLENISEGISEANVNENEPNETDLKVNSVPCEEADFKEAQEPCSVEIITKNTPGKRKLQFQGKWRGIDPVVFFKDEEVINSIKVFYGIDDQFPFNGHLVTRNSDTSHVKRIYYISKSVKDVLELNFSVGQQLKITSVGLKVFERQTSCEGRSAQCSFRITSEGLPLILPHVSKQILRASVIDFKHLLQYRAVKFADFVDAKFGESAANLMPGCCVIVLGEGSRVAAGTLQVDESTVAIGCWKGRASLTVMVGALECQELLQRLLMRLDTQTEKDSSMHEDQPFGTKGDEAQVANDKNEEVGVNGC
ncbi:tRNA (cytosine(34)-C(5))-methyltransferase [Vigna radiata var. radiata]|uniref:tRNA (Cytosine(34)-C(5))-methyltransferase n=1 Tax=Vigna radiata var. radiata TaxID=3916 RepID=A0A1S3TL32_VIGRR|nr:tRNA (cytosine(34)-C(5))-methyltransferase [Vigna radiata var. radiata]